MFDFHKKRTLCIRGSLYDLAEPLVMGILNYTPDSFYDGGRHPDPSAAVQHVGQMIEDGAGIIDFGAVSTRPGAGGVSEDEEIRRLSAVLGIVRDKFPDLIISVDTYRAGVAKKMVSEFGADMINDVSSGDMDERMHETIAELQVPYVAMHMQGTPQTMQSAPRYKDVVNDIIGYFAEKVHEMRGLGIRDIIIDPGFGFGKTLEHNYTLAGRLDEFSILELPLLVGFSRKSMICKTLKVNPDKALPGTIALNAAALLKGADIFRVHDVREARDTIKVVRKLMDFSASSS